LGPLYEGSEKFEGGIVRDNDIYLKNGYEGIHVRKCDDFEIEGNTISGTAYYGIRISGHRKFGDSDMGSFNNNLKRNNLARAHYVLNHSDGKMFSQLAPRTAYIWLDRFSKNNKIYISDDNSLINEGEDNEFIHTNLKI
jgi:parallel beta-helix repeat protein